MIYQLWWSNVALVVVVPERPKNLEACLRQVARTHGATSVVSWCAVDAASTNPALARATRVRDLVVSAGEATCPPGVEVFERPFPGPHVGEQALLWTGPDTSPIPVTVLSGNATDGYETQPSCQTGCRIPHNCLFPLAAAPLLHRATALVGSHVGLPGR